MCVGCHFSWHVRAAQMQFGNLLSHHLALFIMRINFLSIRDCYHASDSSQSGIEDFWLIFVIMIMILTMMMVMVTIKDCYLAPDSSQSSWLSLCGHSRLDTFLLLWEDFFVSQLPWDFFFLYFLSYVTILSTRIPRFALFSGLGRVEIWSVTDQHE